MVATFIGDNFLGVNFLGVIFLEAIIGGYFHRGQFSLVAIFWRRGGGNFSGGNFLGGNFHGAINNHFSNILPEHLAQNPVGTMFKVNIRNTRTR